ncbi:MAG: hypothetical protein DYG89_48765 [Caldilinea sp. CFX5]|nr:hypothetical protein [Caldilinea sp. CFX5]
MSSAPSPAWSRSSTTRPLTNLPSAPICPWPFSRRRQGDTRQGDKETRRQGDKETRRQGDREIDDYVSCLVSRVSCLVSRVSCLVSRVSCLTVPPVSRAEFHPVPETAQQIGRCHRL